METRVVDNRTFLFGLDELYRTSMKGQERGELLRHARAVAQTLRVAPADVPIEGYYTEDEELREYFRLIRALQSEPESRNEDVRGMPAFQRLYDVTSSRLFGEAKQNDQLLPTGRDALSRALLALADWTVPGLTARARQEAEATDDSSLVGLASYVEDPVVLTALRESVVLYAEMVALGEPAPPVYQWRVDAELAQRAARFVDTFNALFPNGRRLPAPIAANADEFWVGNPERRILGRCVRLGWDQQVPTRYYHWAIRKGADLSLEVEDFWDTEVWTTERYRQSRLAFDPRPI